MALWIHAQTRNVGNSTAGKRLVRSSTILHDCIEMIGASGDTLFNIDETRVTTVQKVPKVVATKGLKQGVQITSKERGELVTVCVIVSASGETLPSAFVFPRKNVKEFMMHGSPVGSLGLVDSSGWMFIVLMMFSVNQ